MEDSLTPFVVILKLWGTHFMGVLGHEYHGHESMSGEQSAKEHDDTGV
jgi:hypothetical protein